MKCPYQNSLVPPCKIESHPQRDNVEYCKVCGEWRYLSDVGGEVPNVFWVVVTSLVIGMLMVGLLREDEMFRRNNHRRYDRGYIGWTEIDPEQVTQLPVASRSASA
ncbi:MAG: hypothetical protein NW224_03170 [Leptolyngbyaceae cyanobacterium bins.302]|nr:hypothetical protein [Leptolyngbyaceae cyanobacterium bins.302]